MNVDTETAPVSIGPNRSALVFNVGVTALDVGVALVAFSVARRAGAGEATAYLIGSVGPLLGVLAVRLRGRVLSGASIAILGFTVLSAVVALAGNRNGDALLYKDAITTGLVGLVFAASMVLRRPLAFYFGQRYATDGSHEQMRDWAGLWRYPRFRRANYVITAVWAVAGLLDAGAKAWVIGVLGFDRAYVWTQILPWIVTAVAVLLTIAVARYFAGTAPASAESPRPC